MVLLLIGAAFRADATITQVIGGPGGSQFSIECPPGQGLVGLHASAGAWVDAIAPLCAAPGGTPHQTGWAGGTGGAPQEIYCPEHEYVRSIYMTFTRGNDLPRQYVNTIGIRCLSADGQVFDGGCILSGDEDEDNFVYNWCSFRDGPVSVGWTIDADPVFCPADEVMTGVVGRSGSYVDALGAICGAKPAATVMIPTQKLPPAPDKSDSSKVSTAILIPTQKMTVPAPPSAAEKAMTSAAVLSPVAPPSPPPPMAGVPPMDEALPVPIDGTYDTTFGKLTLKGSSGDYSYSDGKVSVSRVQGNWVEGTWEQSKSSRQCDDGRYYGRFRFEFTAAGFTGIYGYCGDDPGSANVWDGSRL
jgi:hypothetical protein